MSSLAVAFQGVNGAYSEIAARRYFGKRTKTLACEQFEHVFKAVSTGRVRYGIIPIENSLTGSIHQNYDLLFKHSLSICGEIKLRVSHALLALPGTRRQDVRHVYSHPQALWQCSRFLKKLKRAEPVAFFDTAGSAKMIHERKLEGAAAIASQEAGRCHGLRVLASAIEDNKENFTRFLVIGRKAKAGGDKISLCFALKDVPGALHHSLGEFAARGMQLQKIESRPIAGRPWEYLFYLDFLGTLDSAEAREALIGLRRSARRIKVLGCYRRAEW